MPPKEEQKLRDKLGNLPFSISQELLNAKEMKYFKVIQECDEILFVPSKWFHQVKNTEHAVSINHNWFNGCNILFIIDELLNHHRDVEREIADCKDMENFYEHCQAVLKSSFGMNFSDMIEILQHICSNRTKLFQKIEMKTNYQGCRLSWNESYNF